MADVLVLCAHPDLAHSRVNAALMEAARAAGPRVEVRDLYASYPDFFIDLAAEQAALLAAQLVVWQHPLHWYGMPPLMKLWLDEVFAFGWAYGPGGTALKGKDLWLVVSTGGTEDSYSLAGHHRHYFDAFLPPYEQTAALAGMRFLPPLVQHGAHRVGEADIAALAAAYGQRLASYPAWPELAELSTGPACIVPQDERPADAG